MTTVCQGVKTPEKKREMGRTPEGPCRLPLRCVSWCSEEGRSGGGERQGHDIPAEIEGPEREDGEDLQLPRLVRRPTEDVVQHGCG